MRSSSALLALVLASVVSREGLADDPNRPASPPAPSSSAPPRGFLSRFRRQAEPVVPPRPARPVAPPSVEQPQPRPGPSVPPRGLTPLPAPVPSLTPGPRVSAASSGKDAPIRRAQATPTDLGAPILPGMAQPQPDLGGQSISLQQALTGALTSNPDLVALRTGNPSAASAEAVEVARRFPVTLNPTVFIDYRPITLIPRGTFGTGSPAGSSSTTGSFYHNGQGYLLVALRQPVEWGHQTTHRYNIAKASHTALQWQIVQAELTALVQTYRFFQTAAYRREKLRVAEQLATFNENLLETLDARLKANPKLAPDLPLARVEARASRQQAKAARQDYVTALTDLRNQIGIPETAAETEPLGEFELPGTIPPMDEQAMVQAALQCRPDLHAAQAQIEAACAAVRLAKGDRIPTTIIGPQYVQDEAGLQYVGLNLVPILPILNSGKPLVAQREAEQRRATVAYQQAQQRAVAQVRSAVAKWNGARSLVNDSSGLTQQLAEDVTNLERFYEANQVDLSRVQQARQRLIQLENAQLDAVWAATQAQADLLLALGVPNLIQSLLQAAEADAGVAPNPDGRQPSTLAPAPAPAAASIPASPPTPSPFAPVIR